MLEHADLQYIRDVIKETIETDEVENTRTELQECLEKLESVL
jgi:hypothetical protein